MKAILKYDLPEEMHEHSYALAGLDALLLIDNLLSEIRSELNHHGGQLHEWQAEVYNDSTNHFERRKVTACQYTLERVRDLVLEWRQERRLPELA